MSSCGGRKDVGCCVIEIFRNKKNLCYCWLKMRDTKQRTVCWQESLATSWVKEQPAERDHVIWKLEKYIVRICTYNVIHFISPIVALLQSYLVGRHLVSWMHLGKPGCRISWSKITFTSPWSSPLDAITDNVIDFIVWITTPSLLSWRHLKWMAIHPPHQKDIFNHFEKRNQSEKKYSPLTDWHLLISHPPSHTLARGNSDGLDIFFLIKVVCFKSTNTYYGGSQS